MLDLIHTCHPVSNSLIDQLHQAANIETKIKDTRAFLSSDESQDPEAIRTKVGELQQASLKVFEVAYKKVWSGG